MKVQQTPQGVQVNDLVEYTHRQHRIYRVSRIETYGEDSNGDTMYGVFGRFTRRSDGSQNNWPEKCLGIEHGDRPFSILYQSSDANWD